jgi:hypothetical protein
LPLFGRLIQCGTCQHLLSAHGNAHNGKTKYACQSAGEKQAACGTQVWEHYLLPAVLKELSKMLKGYHPGFDGATRIAEVDARLARIDKDIRVLESRFAVPDASVEAIQTRIAELREARHQTLQERVVLDEQQERLQSVQNALDDFGKFFGLLDRKSQLEAMQRFVKRIDLGVTDIVIHWWFSAEVSTLPRTEVSPRRGRKGLSGRVVEIGGLEPPTSCMPCRRSPS